MIYSVTFLMPTAREIFLLYSGNRELFRIVLLIVGNNFIWFIKVSREFEMNSRLWT